MGDARVRAAKPFLSLVNSATLFLLIYANTALALPDAIAYPDYDFLTLVVGLTAILCGAAFTAGWCVGRLWKTDRAVQTALMFGLGMNNNGTGLVLASMALTNQPRVMLPIIIYNLLQHLMAGSVAQYRGRDADLVPESKGTLQLPLDGNGPAAGTSPARVRAGVAQGGRIEAADSPGQEIG
jgi:BASS family bile acid:Na+ symporter